MFGCTIWFVFKPEVQVQLKLLSAAIEINTNPSLVWSRTPASRTVASLDSLMSVCAWRNLDTKSSGDMWCSPFFSTLAYCEGKDNWANIMYLMLRPLQYRIEIVDKNLINFKYVIDAFHIINQQTQSSHWISHLIRRLVQCSIPWNVADHISVKITYCIDQNSNHKYLVLQTRDITEEQLCSQLRTTWTKTTSFYNHRDIRRQEKGWLLKGILIKHMLVFLIICC